LKRMNTIASARCTPTQQRLKTQKSTSKRYPYQEFIHLEGQAQTAPLVRQDNTQITESPVGAQPDKLVLKSFHWRF